MTKRRFWRVALGLGTCVQLLSAGCTNGNPAQPAPADNGGTGGGGGAAGDNTVSSMPDASTGGSGGTGGSQQAMPDASTADAKPQCASMGSTNACTGCCSDNHQEGTNVFFRALTQCACQTGVCGPAAPPPAETGDGGAEGGTAAGDGGGGSSTAQAQGGPCTSECTNPNMNGVGSSCSTCIRSSIGMEGNAGPCEMQIASTCGQNDDCSALFSCLQTCP